MSRLWKEFGYTPGLLLGKIYISKKELKEKISENLVQDFFGKLKFGHF